MLSSRGSYRRLPKFIPVPAEILFSPETTLVTYYGKLRALAWSNQFLYIEPLPVEQLWIWMGLKRRQFYNVIEGLERLHWIETAVPEPYHLTIRFVDLSEGQILILTGSGSLEVEAGVDESLSAIVQPIAPSSSSSSLNLKKNNLLLLSDSEENVSAMNCTDPDPLQEIAFQALVKRKVHPDIARALLAERTPAFCLEKSEVYDWCARNGISQGAGYLVHSIRNDWLTPDRFVPPGYCCPECGGDLRRREGRHTDTCKERYQDYGENPLDTEGVCLTCGAYLPEEDHAADCWRGKVAKT